LFSPGISWGKYFKTGNHRLHRFHGFTPLSDEIGGRG